MSEQPIYPMQGHPTDCMDLGCKRCHRFLARLIRNIDGSFKLDDSIYQTDEWKLGVQPPR